MQRLAREPQMKERCRYPVLQRELVTRDRLEASQPIPVEMDETIQMDSREMWSLVTKATFTYLTLLYMIAAF